MKDTHFYIGFGVFIFLVATWLCYAGKLPADSYVNLVEWDVLSVCGGGAFSSLRTLQLGGKKNGAQIPAP